MDCSLPYFSVHGISRQEYWSELPFPSPGNLPDSGIKPASPASQQVFFFFFFFKSPNHRRHNSEDLGKKSVSQYPFHPCASNVCLSIILALPADLHQYFFLCVYYLKPGHFSSCCWFTYYCCFLETVFLFSGLKFRYLFPRH